MVSLNHQTLPRLQSVRSGIVQIHRNLHQSHRPLRLHKFQQVMKMNEGFKLTRYFKTSSYHLGV